MKIRLFCAAGMSTSLLVTKMREAAKAMGIDADIEAAGETRMNEETEGCDSREALRLPAVGSGVGA